MCERISHRRFALPSNFDAMHPMLRVGVVICAIWLAYAMPAVMAASPMAARNIVERVMA